MSFLNLSTFSNLAEPFNAVCGISRLSLGKACTYCLPFRKKFKLEKHLLATVCYSKSGEQSTVLAKRQFGGR